MRTQNYVAKHTHAQSQFGVVKTSLRYPAPRFLFLFLFHAYSIENEGLGNSFTFFVTFPGMLAVTAEHKE